MAAPLVDLLMGVSKVLRGNPGTAQAFQRLKKVFTSEPILKQPDPKLPFTVEVDASSQGVGTVLSQRQDQLAKLHTVAYFSKKLSPAEQNYDVGDRELLGIKLALEEWRHWLEGAKHPYHTNEKGQRLPACVFDMDP